MSLGCYDEVVTYDRIEALPQQPVAFVDMAGNPDLRTRLHRHFGDRLVYSGRVGLTHQDAAPDDESLPGAKPTWFFAPDQIANAPRNGARAESISDSARSGRVSPPRWDRSSTWWKAGVPMPFSMSISTR